jgi:cysteine desulfurase
MAPHLPIYLDHNATTPVDQRVFEAMRPYFCEIYGNAASRNHSFGWAAEKAVDHARQQVAALLGADPRDIIWTSGATEANNLALKGIAQAYADKGRHIITQVTEHKAVLDPCGRLEKEGYEVTYLPVDSGGRVSAQQVAQAIRDDTILVSIMAANNEIGTLQPLGEIGHVCKQKGVLFHSDATQAVGKVSINVEADGIDLLSLSAHKFYGPKGCGALYVRRKNPRVRLVAQMDGGGHERGFRSGTLNVPGIVGCGAACELAAAEMPAEAKRTAALRDRLEQGIVSQVDYVTINGDRAHRLPQTTNLSIAYVEGESLMMALEDVAVSSGSACTSASLQSSYVLRAIGVGADLAPSSLRIGVGRFTTEQEIDYVVEKAVRGIQRLRQLSPLYEMVQEGIDLARVQWKE